MSKKPTETINESRRGLLLGRLQMPESKGELILVQKVSSRVIDPLREEVGTQGKSLITATPDELKDMQTLDVQIAHYRVEVLKRGISELELDTLIERVVEKILGAKVERRSFLQGMKHLLLHREFVRDFLKGLTERPMVQMPKFSNLIANITDVYCKDYIATHALESYGPRREEFTCITLSNGSMLEFSHVSHPYTMEDNSVSFTLSLHSYLKLEHFIFANQQLGQQRKEINIDANADMQLAYLNFSPEIEFLCHHLNFRKSLIHIAQHRRAFNAELQKRLQTIPKEQQTWEDKFNISSQLGREGWIEGQEDIEILGDSALKIEWKSWKEGDPVPECVTTIQHDQDGYPFKLVSKK